MVSFTAAPTETLLAPRKLTHFGPRIFPSCVCAIGAGRRAVKVGNFRSLDLKVAFGKGIGSGFSFWGFSNRRKRGSGNSSSCLCDSEGDLALEAEILKFMKDSQKPESFPSKKELVDAGRMDLVEGIQRQGGWLTFGWDLDDDGVDSKEEEEEEKIQQPQFQEKDNGQLDFSQRGKTWDDGAYQERIDGEVGSSGASSFSLNSSCSPSSSGRSLDAASEDESGIEGILSRLEKERNANFGFSLKEKEKSSRLPCNDHQDDHLVQRHTTIVVGPERRPVPSSSRGIIDDSTSEFSRNQTHFSVSDHGNSNKPDVWKKWSIQTAGSSDSQFEGDEIVEIRDSSSELDRRKEPIFSQEDINPNKIRGRLEHLDLELSSALRSLRSETDNGSSQEDDGSSEDNVEKLSDALEFQQNEISTAQGKLRSIRAKLAVLEGKMALSIIDTQKIVEQKQRKIDDARRALRLLRTAYIVWANSASEVLVAGSFDGWTTQRKMERSSSGVFSLTLKLYPGRYEIKFVVDGKWRIDPLRPVVHNNGHENNLLIVT